MNKTRSRLHVCFEEFLNQLNLLYICIRSRFMVTINIGLHQESALSPYLFALVMDEVTRDIQDGIPWCMLFTDDVI
jgi:hypothetical protein